MIAELFRPSRRAPSLALHAFAGVLVGVIASELAPRSFEGARSWAAALAFLAGGAAFLVVELIADRLTAGAGQTTDEQSGAWVFFAGRIYRPVRRWAAHRQADVVRSVDHAAVLERVEEDAR